MVTVIKTIPRLFFSDLFDLLHRTILRLTTTRKFRDYSANMKIQFYCLPVCEQFLVPFNSRSVWVSDCRFHYCCVVSFCSQNLKQIYEYCSLYESTLLV